MHQNKWTESTTCKSGGLNFILVELELNMSHLLNLICKVKTNKILDCKNKLSSKQIVLVLWLDGILLTCLKEVLINWAWTQEGN